VLEQRVGIHRDCYVATSGEETNGTRTNDTQLCSNRSSMPNVTRIVVPVIIFAGLIAALIFSQQQNGPLRVSGFVEADQIRVGSRVGGRVARVFAQEGLPVKVGDLLLELEPFDLAAQRQFAEAERSAAEQALQQLVAGLRPEEIAQQQARLDQLTARFDELKNGSRKEELETAQARLRQALAQLALADHDYQRAQELETSKQISGAQLDQATRALRDAEGGRDVRVAELALLQAGTRSEVLAAAKAAVQSAEAALSLAKQGSRIEVIAQARAQLAASTANLARVDAQIAELRIVSPVNGFIETVDLQPGDLVAANAPVLSIIDTTHLWVRAYLPENQLRFQPGNEVEVTVDSFPAHVFRGTLTFLSQQAEFTPGNVQTPEERSKQVFRIKVTVADDSSRLRPGMAADVWLEPRITK
jgi:HlyD family secretion protein